MKFHEISRREISDFDFSTPIVDEQAAAEVVEAAAHVHLLVQKAVVVEDEDGLGGDLRVHLSASCAY